MMPNLSRLARRSSRVAFALWGMTAASSAFAQGTPPIRPDGTTPTTVIPGPAGTYTVTGGTMAGPPTDANLFHSFQSFSLNPGETVVWTGPNPAGVKRIINRVTGGDVSVLRGTFKSEYPNADLYFINPAGVIFGDGFSFNAPRSFYVSTAPVLRFSDHTQLVATGAGGSSFSAAAPESFGFLGGRTGSVVLSGLASTNIFFTQSGATFAIAASDVRIDNSNFQLGSGTLRLAAIGDRTIDFGFGSTQGLAGLSGEIAISGSNFTTSVGGIDMNAGRLALTNSNINAFAAPASGVAPGAIELRGGSLLLSGSTIFSQTAAGLTPGADIRLAGGDISVQGGKITTEAIDAAKGGSILIEGSRVALGGGVRIETATRGAGDGGSIQIRALAGSLTAQDAIVRTVAGTPTLLAAAGAGGLIELKASDGISVVDTGVIAESYATSKQVGSINIDATNGLLIERRVIDPVADADRSILIISRSNTPLGARTPSTLKIHAGTLETRGLADRPDRSQSPSGRASIKYLAEGTQPVGLIDIDVTGAANFGRADIISQVAGTAGATGANVKIKAGDLSLDSTIVEAILPTGTTGNSGSIRIDTTRDLRLTNRSTISAAAEGLGRSGDIDIVIGRDATIAGLSRIDTDIGGDATGAGTVTVTAKSGTLTVRDRQDLAVASAISSSTVNKVDGGRIVIDVAHLVLTAGGVISAITDSSSGNGGNIKITAGTVAADGFGSRISASALAAGNGAAGSIEILADQILFTDQADISTISSAGTGGNVLIRSSRLSLLNGGRISTDSGPGTAGNINIIMPRSGLLILDGRVSPGVITTSSTSNTGGTITISEPAAIISNGGQILATGPGGQAKVQIESDYFIRSSDRLNLLSVDGSLLLDSQVSDVSRGTQTMLPQFVDAYGVLIGQCAGTRGDGGVSELGLGRLDPYAARSRNSQAAAGQVPAPCSLP